MRGIEGHALSEVRPAPAFFKPDVNIVTAQPSPSEINPAYLGPVLLMKPITVPDRARRTRIVCSIRSFTTKDFRPGSWPVHLQAHHQCAPGADLGREEQRIWADVRLCTSALEHLLRTDVLHETVIHIVDDDDAVLTSLGRLLRSVGYTAIDVRIGQRVPTGRPSG